MKCIECNSNSNQQLNQIALQSTCKLPANYLQITWQLTMKNNKNNKNNEKVMNQIMINNDKKNKNEKKKWVLLKKVV